MFGWYINNEEKKTRAKLTVAILLSKTESSMKSLTKKVINYEGKGITIAFPSCLYIINLIFLWKAQMKLCFFLQDSYNIITSSFGIRCTQNKQIRKQNGQKNTVFCGTSRKFLHYKNQKN